MTSKEFAAKVQADMACRLGENYHVCTKEVIKNNGVGMEAVLISAPGRNITPTIYLQTYFERFAQGEPWDSVTESIIEAYRQGLPEERINMDFYRDFSKVRDRIAYKLINAERNRELLSEIPHVMFFDLAICFYYAFSHEKLGNGSILVYNTQMEAWNTNTAELMRLAQKNTKDLFGVEVVPMEELMSRMLTREMGTPDDLWEEDISIDTSMLILSSRSHTFGAAAMLLPDVLAGLADRADTGLYILPSSIHEVILIPESGREDITLLKEMVKEVNDTMVSREEILSDSVYYYDRNKREITCF